MSRAVRWGLAGKVRLEHDPAMTLRGALATVPVGEALREAGERATDWLPAVSGESVVCAVNAWYWAGGRIGWVKKVGS